MSQRQLRDNQGYRDFAFSNLQLLQYPRLWGVGLPEDVSRTVKFTQHEVTDRLDQCSRPVKQFSIGTAHSIASMLAILSQLKRNREDNS